MDKLKVLIIDDNYEESKNKIMQFYKSEFYEIDNAYDYDDIFQKIKEQNYDFISLDCDLSGFKSNINPLTIFKHLLTLIEELSKPIVILSAQAFVLEKNNEYLPLLFERKDLKVWDIFSFQMISEIKNDGLVKFYFDKYNLLVNSNISSYNLNTEKLNEKINILHISDLEFTSPGTTINQNGMGQSIYEYLKKSGLDFIDLIVCTGDFTYQGNCKGFDDALKFFENELSRLFKNEIKKNNRWRKRIIICPGNHDVNLVLDLNKHFNYSSKNSEENNKYGIIAHDIGNGVSIVDKKTHEECKSYKLQPFREFAFKLTYDMRWLEEETLTFINDDFLSWNLRFFIMNTVDNFNYKDFTKKGFNDSTLPQKVKEKHTIDFYISHYPTEELGLTKYDGDKFKAPLSVLRQNQMMAENFSYWLAGDIHVQDFKDENRFKDFNLNMREFNVSPLFSSSHISKDIYTKACQGFYIFSIDNKKENIHFHTCEVSAGNVSCIDTTKLKMKINS